MGFEGRGENPVCGLNLGSLLLDAGIELVALEEARLSYFSHTDTRAASPKLISDITGRYCISACVIAA